MFEKDRASLADLGADITTEEIKQQPEIWLETLDIYKQKKDDIEGLLTQIKDKTEGKVRIIFTGAGTSQYVGDTIVPYLNRVGDTGSYIFESIGTTDIVSAPLDYLKPEETTVLISFGRSGNSPESLAAVNLANKWVKNIYHIVITCAKDGALATGTENKDNSILVLAPERSNDKGFAMTGSFTCMMLSALLIFDQTAEAKKEDYVRIASGMGKEVIRREQEIAAILDREYDRIVYLGSGSLAGLAREAQLKVLELTAGKTVTVFDSSMGFRHGPKSFVNEKTLMFVFVSNNPKIRRYDVDVLEEVVGDQIAAAVSAIGQKVEGAAEFGGGGFIFEEKDLLPEGYLALPDIMVAQTVSLLSALKVGNTPDTPSPTGTVNRVVKGVHIYED